MNGTIFGNAKASLRLLAARSVFLWQTYMRLTGKPLPDPRQIDMIVEGYPRSGNTYAEHMLRIMCPGLRRISHTHSVGTLLWAKKHGIPSLILVREPLDAAISLFIYRLQAASLALCLEEWEAFYRAAKSLPKTAFIPFEDLIEATEKSLSSSLKALDLDHFIESSLPPNPRQSFEASHDHDKWHLKEFRKLNFGEEQGNRPSDARRETKRQVLSFLDSCQNKKIHREILKCNDLYQKLINPPPAEKPQSSA